MCSSDLWLQIDEEGVLAGGNGLSINDERDFGFQQRRYVRSSAPYRRAEIQPLAKVVAAAPQIPTALNRPTIKDLDPLAPLILRVDDAGTVT